MWKNDRRNDRNRIMTSLQKRMALEYQKKVGIPTFSPGLIEHIPLYVKMLYKLASLLYQHVVEIREFTNQTIIMTYRLPVFHTRRK